MMPMASGRLDRSCPLVSALFSNSPAMLTEYSGPRSNASITGFRRS